MDPRPSPAVVLPMAPIQTRTCPNCKAPLVLALPSGGGPRTLRCLDYERLDPLKSTKARLVARRAKAARLTERNGQSRVGLYGQTVPSSNRNRICRSDRSVRLCGLYFLGLPGSRRRFPFTQRVMMLHSVHQYRAHISDDKGPIIGYEPLVCSNDGAAATGAKGLVDGHDVDSGAALGSSFS
jgi:hypothetical protein